MMLFVGGLLYELDQSNNEIRDIYNYTESTFIWNYSLTGAEYDKRPEDLLTARAINVLHRFIDFIGFAFFESIKFLIEFGYEKADKYEIKDFIFIIKLIFIVVIISFVVPVIILTLALLYLLFEGLKWVINKWRN